MKYFILACLLFSAQAALADDFSARATTARARAGNTEGAKYDITLWPILNQAAAVCDPPGTVLPDTELGHFNLVGDITADGKMINIEVRPETNMAKCYAAQMAKAHFLHPPLVGGPTYPVLLDMKVTN
ncbi:MAG: hypothetical protein B7Z75_12245 [Acidocella sp. 20-57-95]|nr:MAG: hypothetical protein B7Z75_12245 [Acidocella sp. 20-57-95]OYV62169.1 MAG: hypothetical protein B7Z71_02340 [Acidocella sp. 21-58-7]HQT65308.1 hypothetical protein [Acidocella sp.]